MPDPIVILVIGYFITFLDLLVNPFVNFIFI